LEAEVFEAFDELAFESRPVERVEIVWTEIAVDAAIADDAIGDTQNENPCSKRTPEELD
jgi:hypothetical protein